MKLAVVRALVMALLVHLSAPFVSAQGAAAAAQMKIVALSPHIVETLYALGLQQQIVATVDYADYPQSARLIPRVGGHYGLEFERILALKPDLIIAWRGGNRAEDLAKLSQLGLNLIYVDADNISTFIDSLATLGQAVGRSQEADALAKRYQMRFQSIKNQYQTRSPIKVFYQLWPEPLMSVNNDTAIGQMLSYCGAVNVTAHNASQYPTLSIEHVIHRAPEIIVIADEQSSAPPQAIDWQRWPMIPAVKGNRFIRVDADKLHRIGPRTLEALANLCQSIDGHRP